MDFLLDTLHTYYLLVRFDSSFALNFFGFIIQVLTLIFAFYGLKQVTELKKQNALSAHRDKIDYLEKFQELIAEAQKFQKNKIKIKNSSLDLDNYFLQELEIREEAGNKRYVFNCWNEVFLNDNEIMQEATNLANKLELFAIAISREEILKDLKSVVAVSFCSLVESNPAVYILNRISQDSKVHALYQNTIALRRTFIKEVGSMEERARMQRENAAKASYKI